MDRLEPVDAYIGLGGNIGDRLRSLQRAAESMTMWPDTEVVGASSIYESEAHVLPDADRQPDHLNAVIHLRTGLTPAELLNRLHSVERSAGRDPEAPPWSPRPLDLDLLVYGSVALDTDELMIPHPRIADRRFVLLPLADVAPALVIGERTVSELLEATPDRTRILRTDLSWISTDPCSP